MRGTRCVRTAVVVCSIAWPAIVAAQAAKTPAVPRPGVTVQGFSVVLLLGDLQGGTTADNVPPAARKALVDMKDFLPYKSYRFLDTAWTLASNNGVHSTMRLRGLENQEFELNLTGVSAPGPGAPARLNLSFGLGESGFDGGAPPHVERSAARLNEQRHLVAELEGRLARFDGENPTAERQLERVTDPEERREAQARRREERLAIAQQLAAGRERLKVVLAEQMAGRAQDLEVRKVQLADLEGRRKALEDNLQSLKSRYNSAHPQVVPLQAELDRLSMQLASARDGARSATGRRIIDTSFSMDVGETVVVGTSRLGGDKAIIALLTAVARGR